MVPRSQTRFENERGGSAANLLAATSGGRWLSRDSLAGCTTARDEAIPPLGGMASFHRTLRRGRPILFVPDAALPSGTRRHHWVYSESPAQVDEDGGWHGRRG